MPYLQPGRMERLLIAWIVQLIIRVHSENETDKKSVSENRKEPAQHAMCFQCSRLRDWYRDCLVSALFHSHLLHIVLIHADISDFRRFFIKLVR